MSEMLREPREIMRDEMVMRDRVLASLKDGPKTVPEIAEALGCPTYEVMHWVMAARRYGLVKEIGQPTEDDYYQYALVEAMRARFLQLQSAPGTFRKSVKGGVALGLVSTGRSFGWISRKKPSKPTGSLSRLVRSPFTRGSMAVTSTTRSLSIASSFPPVKMSFTVRWQTSPLRST